MARGSVIGPLLADGAFLRRLPLVFISGDPTCPHDFPSRGVGVPSPEACPDCRCP